MVKAALSTGCAVHLRDQPGSWRHMSVVNRFLLLWCAAAAIHQYLPPKVPLERLLSIVFSSSHGDVPSSSSSYTITVVTSTNSCPGVCSFLHLVRVPPVRCFSYAQPRRPLLRVQRPLRVRPVVVVQHVHGRTLAGSRPIQVRAYPVRIATQKIALSCQ